MDRTQAEVLGRYVRSRRVELGLTTRQVGARCGIDRGSISRIENGAIRLPGPDKLAALASALDLRLADLYALAGYVVPTELPDFQPYLRTKYRHQLPASALAELERMFDDLSGAHHQPPAYGEDETPEAPPQPEGGRRVQRTPTEPRK